MRVEGTKHFYFYCFSSLTDLSVCSCDHQETLLSLSHKMSEYQKELKDAAETLKVRQSLQLDALCPPRRHLIQFHFMLSTNETRFWA